MYNKCASVHVGGYAYVHAHPSSLAQSIHLRIAQEVFRAKASAEFTTMNCECVPVYDQERMYEAMRALVGERPHDVKRILGVGNNAKARLCCMLFEIEQAHENESEATYTCSQNIGIAVFSEAPCTVLALPPCQEGGWLGTGARMGSVDQLQVGQAIGSTGAAWPSFWPESKTWQPTTNTVAQEIQTLLNAKHVPRLVLAKDPASTKNTSPKIWVRENRRHPLQPLDQHVLDALLANDGCILQNLVRADAVLIQKVLAVVPEDQKTAIIKELARCPTTCQTLSFCHQACFVVSQLQLEGLVCWACDSAHDVFSPGAPTCTINEHKACLASSALEFVASFAITDERHEDMLDKCIKDKHFNHTFCLWLQLIIRLVRIGTNVRSDSVVDVSDRVSRFASTCVPHVFLTCFCSSRR
jgi:hypothetical protein